MTYALKPVQIIKTFCRESHFQLNAAERVSVLLCTPQGELNGHKGLVPSNFLEEVPDDVEVFLTDSPSRYPQDTPARIKTKRVHAPSQY